MTKANPTVFPFVVTVLLLAGTLAVDSASARRSPEPLAVPLEQISPRIAGWEAFRDSTLAAPTLHALAATSVLSRIYRKESRELDLFVAFYAQQRAGESMHSPKHCLPGAGWEIWKHDSAWIPMNGKNVEINKYSIQNQGDRRIVIYWYQSKTRIVASEYLGKVLLAKDAIFTGHTAGAIVRIVAPDTPEAAGDGLAFATSVVPEVQRCFGK